MIVKQAELTAVRGVKSAMPDLKLPQIAFAGRSNVGKSSLINTLTNRRSLARTSMTPGKTQTVNFYLINRELYFVDLPGYGYAKVPAEVKRMWGPMVERYLYHAKLLKAVMLLVDIRHAPKADDVSMCRWIEAAGFTPVIIATKLDKIKKSELRTKLRVIKDTLEIEDTKIIPFSAQTKQGREEILEFAERCLSDSLEAACRPAKG